MEKHKSKNENKNNKFLELFTFKSRQAVILSGAKIESRPRSLFFSLILTLLLSLSLSLFSFSISLSINFVSLSTNLSNNLSIDLSLFMINLSLFMSDASFSLFTGLGDANTDCNTNAEGTRLKVGVDSTSVELEL